MNDFENKNPSEEEYDTEHFSTPIDPAPIEPEEMNDGSTTGSTYAYSFRKAEPKKEEQTPVMSDVQSTTSTQAEQEQQRTAYSQPEQEQQRTTYSQPEQEQQRTAYTQSGQNTQREPYMYHTQSAYQTIPKMPDLSKKPQKSKKKKSSGSIFKKFLLCISLAIVFGVVAGGVFLGVSAVGSEVLGLSMTQETVDTVPKIESTAPSTDNSSSTSAPASATSANGDLTVAQVAEQCMPAMVAITTKSITEVPNYFGFGIQNYESTSSGSGIIIDQNEQELLIATNNHVVAGANTLTVAFVDETLVEGTIKGTDADNDLAVVSVKLSDISNDTLKAIKVIQIGNSDEMAVGDQVVAIGNALGYGQSVSSGWVSALDREVSIDNITLTLLQTDAAINPGNSGGALLNMRGELIGINESKYADTSVEGMGYAIPVSTATPILSNLMSKETRYKVDEDDSSYIGITCKDISADFASMYGVPTGVYVDSVEENGPAAQAGIKKGDIITKFDGTKLSSYTDLVSKLEYYAAGEIVEVTIARADDGEYKEQTVLVTLGSVNDSDFLQQSNK